MNTLLSIELSLIDEIFRGDAKGYVLDFSNRTFTDFFARELDVDIDASQYAADGSSKGKRLRCFLGQVDDATAAKALRALWAHREALRRHGSDPMPNASAQIWSLITRLEKGASPGTANVVAAPKIHAIDFAKLSDRLLAIKELQPHERGYEFERYLTHVFEVFRMQPREPFRNRGEQIDGSFELAGDIYLLEAKWLSRPVGADVLHTFQGKIEQKATWCRGVFISFEGFTIEGLHAFGRGKRIIGVEGRELYEAMLSNIGIDRVIAAKVRRAAESGDVFTPLEELGLVG
ncbi:restriction endonuclease [Pseudomonas sp.]|uniref:restriction endonuclease n=1 Tax=Pseudomonas sp. TaxID=306 RepID=UPI003D1266A9